MAEQRTRRRLAAILAADVVGYGRLMEQDEAGTLAALKSRRRQVLEPLLARHQGRVFKVTGDGVLVEFGSAVNAVQCAVELQQAMARAKQIVEERFGIADIAAGHSLFQLPHLASHGFDVGFLMAGQCRDDRVREIEG